MRARRGALGGNPRPVRRLVSAKVTKELRVSRLPISVFSFDMRPFRRAPATGMNRRQMGISRVKEKNVVLFRQSNVPMFSSKEVSMKKWSLMLVLCAGIVSSVSLSAVSFRGLLGVAAEFGGDRLLTVSYSDGSSSDILVGQGFSFFGGAVVQDLVALGPISFDVQGTVGVKYSTIQEATNANADFYRFPIELMLFADWKGLRLGVGPTYHVGNSFAGSGALAAYNFTFDTALGLVAQIDYLFLKHWGVGARYTVITYTPQESGLSQKSGNNFGAEISYYF